MYIASLRIQKVSISRTVRPSLVSTSQVQVDKQSMKNSACFSGKTKPKKTVFRVWKLYCVFFEIFPRTYLFRWFYSFTYCLDMFDQLCQVIDVLFPKMLVVLSCKCLSTSVALCYRSVFECASRAFPRFKQDPVTPGISPDPGTSTDNPGAPVFQWLELRTFPWLSMTEW